MQNKFFHPLWMHIPVMVSFVALIGSILISLPLPETAPVQLGLSNASSRYGSPWEVIGIMLGLSILFVGISVLLDELWSRQERKKTFNWMTLFDEFIVGAMTGFSIDYLMFLNSGAADYAPSWTWPVLTCLGMLVITVILEILRPFRPSPEQLSEGENADLKAEVTRRISDGTSFAYWDYQNPFYITLITTLLPVVMIVAAVLSWGEQIWVAIILVVTGILMIIPHGGQRVIVTKDRVTVRWGLVGIRVLNLTMDDIDAVDLHQFSALKDFGGYGIRFNREMTAYFMQGSMGVKLETTGRKKYLIGSNRSESLMTVIRAVLENR